MKRLAFLIVCLGIACGCGTGNQLTPQDETNLAKFQAQDAACIAANAPDAAKIDACRAEAKARFEAAEAALMDAGKDAS